MVNKTLNKAGYFPGAGNVRGRDRLTSGDYMKTPGFYSSALLSDPLPTRDLKRESCEDLGLPGFSSPRKNRLIILTGHLVVVVEPS